MKGNCLTGSATLMIRQQPASDSASQPVAGTIGNRGWQQSLAASIAQLSHTQTGPSRSRPFFLTSAYLRSLIIQSQLEGENANHYPDLRESCCFPSPPLNSERSALNSGQECSQTYARSGEIDIRGAPSIPTAHRCTRTHRFGR